MKPVKIKIEVDGKLKRFFLTICSQKELEKIEKTISKIIDSHK